jgi:1,5-anhydro-D-fructose reductase (1,5-anhydro-D-mannitol-forming)
MTQASGVCTDSVAPVRAMVNCGIIGFGKMGRIRARAIAESARGTVVAAYDIHPFKSKTIESVKEDLDIVTHDDIDAVFVCTPNYRNKPLTIAALQAGKHVFCEKPPAFTAEDLAEIRVVEQASGCKLMYGFNHRHHESVKMAKEAIDSGQFGELLWMRGRYGKSVDDSFFSGWRADPKMAGGGILLDQGIHMLDLFLQFGGAFDEVQAIVSNLFWKREGIEDNVFANLRNSETGVVASLHSTMTQWRHIFSLEIFLTKGHVVINGLKTASNSYGDEVLVMEKNRRAGPGVEWGNQEQHTFEVDTSWASEIRSFFDCIEHDTPVTQGSSEDAWRVLELVGRVYAAG